MKNLTFKKFLTLLALLWSAQSLATSCPESLASIGSDPSSRLDALSAARQLVGKYQGHWELFGWDPKAGTIAKKRGWKDTITAMDPAIEEGKAQVLVINKMVYEDGHEETTAFTEGYFVNSDNTAGPRFFEHSGVITVEHVVAPNVWMFHSTATKMDLALMGFGPSMKPEGLHVTVKTTSLENGVVVERVSRISTISWREASGQQRTEQFISLRGVHLHSN